ncbi:MAG TPA: MFS transporter [Polyangiaceae bacterium]|nr:MFS transporter [Polyangiaceae bacterium]
MSTTDATTPSPSHGTATASALFASAVMTAQLVSGKAMRDAFYLSHHASSSLPKMMAISSLVSVALVLGVSHAMTRLSPRRVVPALVALGGVLFLVEWLLTPGASVFASAFLYVHMTTLGSTVTASFWALVNERFDPHTAKQVIARIGAGGTVGGIVGSLLAWRVTASRGGDRFMLLALAGMSALSLVGVWRLGRHRPFRVAPPEPAAEPGAESGPGRPSGPPSLSGADKRPLPRIALEAFRDKPYLRQLAFIVGAMALVSTVLDYLLGARAEIEFGDGPALYTFFALFHVSVSLLSFVAQTALTSRALDRLGLAGTTSTLPASLAAGAALAFAAPGLAAIALVRGAHGVLQNSLFRSGYELLYTPVEPTRKRASKLIIDVVFDRAGAALGSGCAYLAVFLLPEKAHLALLGAVAAVSAAALVAARFIHRGYVASLAESLRRGLITLEAREVFDATTRSALAGHSGATPLPMPAPPLRPWPARFPWVRRPRPLTAPAPPADPSTDPTLRAVADLRSADPARARRALLAGPLGPELAAHALPLLAQDELAAEAARALREAAPRCVGLLLDALLDPTTPLALRRALPPILRGLPSQRAVDGLTEALASDDFLVRYRAAVALATTVSEQPALAPREHALHAALLAELEEGRRNAALPDGYAGEQSDHFADEAWGTPVAHSLRFVFTLLALLYEREPIEIAFRALGASDEALRGTALEYLDNVLPGAIREQLWPLLDDRGPPARHASARSAVDLLDDLKRSAPLLSAVRRVVEGATQPPPPKPEPSRA